MTTEPRPNVRTFDNTEAGIQITAAFVEGVPIRQSDEDEIEGEADLWFFFLAIIGNDSWVSYAITDAMEDEPKRSLINSNLSELKKLSILVGDPMAKIENDYQLASIRHRRMVADLDPEVKSIMMEMSFSEVLEKRQRIDFESIRGHWRQYKMVLSLN